MTVDLRILTGEDVRQLLPMARCIDLMEPTMIAVSDGKAVLPLRTGMRMPRDIGMLGMMSGYIETADMYGTKLVSLFPRNAGTVHSSHLGMLILFETDHGHPVGILDAAEVTAIRTAAASGLATRLLARPNSTRLAILGTGEQARRHLEAMVSVRPIGEAEALAESCSSRHGIAARATDRVADAVDGTDIVCTTTHAAEPILHGEWIGSGTHLNVVGSSIPSTAEIDGALVAKARFFVDYRESTINQAGEYLRALDAGLIGADHIRGEIGEVAAARVPGRTGDDEITLYKSLGIAAQDIAAGQYIVARAAELGIGQIAKFG
jgi:ornithine cyclodeaminase